MPKPTRAIVMSTRHPHNANIRLINQSQWNGLDIINTHGPVIENYLERIHRVMCNAIEDHPRTALFRIDLKFPSEGYSPNSDVITNFFESLKTQIKFHGASLGPNSHPCSVRYLWIREQDSSPHWHYHVAIFLNSDRYKVFGRFKPPIEYSNGHVFEVLKINLSDRIRKAWANALGLDVVEAIGLVHFSGVCIINSNADDFELKFSTSFKWLSYFAKSATKHYGNGGRNMGSSQS